MNDHERKKQELLEELARRFRDSAHTLKSVARRINDASQLHQESVRRMDQADAPLRECVGSDASPLTFTYLEYLEFSSADEFRKFKDLDIITEAEIAEVDWDALCQQLYSAA